MPKKLLVADKSLTIQKSVGITFAQEDFTVTYVSDGEDALAKTKQFKPDILLVHVNTPKLSGYEVCEAVKKDSQLNHIPVLLLVGTHESLDDARFKSCQADGSIIKPFESQTLIERVNELTNRKPGEAKAAVAPGAAAPPKAPQPPPPAAPLKQAQPTSVSPNATIAGQAPPRQAQPVTPNPAPSPASTIAGQSPRDTPLLDLDMDLSPPVQPPSSASPKAEDPNVFEFSLDDSFTSETPHEVSAAPEPAAPTPTQEAEAGGDFWDFADAGSEHAAPVAAEAAPTPDFETPTSENPTAEMEDFSFSPSADEPTETLSPPAEENYAESTFDFSIEPTSQPIEMETEPLETESFVEPLAAFAGPDENPEPTNQARGDSARSAGPALAGNLALSDEQIEAIVTKVFSRVIERIAWEVVPDLAETIIKEELARLTQESS